MPIPTSRPNGERRVTPQVVDKIDSAGRDYREQVRQCEEWESTLWPSAFARTGSNGRSSESPRPPQLQRKSTQVRD